MIAIAFTIVIVALACWPAAPGSRRAIERRYRRNRADLSAARKDRRNLVGQPRKDFE